MERTTDSVSLMEDDGFSDSVSEMVFLREERRERTSSGLERPRSWVRTLCAASWCGAPGDHCDLARRGK